MNETNMSTLLQQLSDDFGQSPWVDNLKRSYLTDGTLADLLRRGVRGVTSNPSIFQKAIAGSTDYDVEFRALVTSGAEIEAAYWALVVDDVARACRLLRDLHVDSDGVDGYVSLEVSPLLAHDAESTMNSARSLNDLVAEPNVMIKIPATVAGVVAIREMITEGLDINVTLIFSLDRYRDVIEAYISGLEARAANGQHDLSNAASVASFFISRVDTEVDRRLAAIGTTEAAALIGKAAVAQAVLAYQLFLECFSGPRWERLARMGARVQRPLWASTSTKNPAFPDTLYVDTLIGPNTVNTLPESTLEAFADHGTVARTVDKVDVIAESARVWSALARVGVDMDDVAEVLERDGVVTFEKAFEELLATLDQRAADFR